jgi:nitrate reductase delta subunit
MRDEAGLARPAGLAGARSSALGGHAVALRAAAWLLRYPDEAALAALPVVRAAVADLPPPVGAGLRAVADHRAAAAPIDLAREYVELFDFRRRCCLYLSYYTDGDTRRRGVGLVAFAAAYKAAGLELTGGELPDFLPAVLELASAHDLGRRLLRDHRVGLDLLGEALTAERSVYAGAVAAVRALLPAAGPDDLGAAARLAAQGPPAELVGLEGYPLLELPGGRR